MTILEILKSNLVGRFIKTKHHLIKCLDIIVENGEDGETFIMIKTPKDRNEKDYTRFDFSLEVDEEFELLNG